MRTPALQSLKSAPSLEMSIPNSPPERIEFSGSSGASDVENLKRDFIVQLYLNEGSFYEAIHRMRTKWSISPSDRLPEVLQDKGGHVDVLWPDDRPKQKASPPLIDLSSLDAEMRAEARAHAINVERHNSKVWEYEKNWVHDVHEIMLREVPRRLGYSRGFWERLISACAVHLPAENDLLAFAECFPVRSRRIALERSHGSENAVYVKELPVRMIPDQEDIELRLLKFFDMVLDEFNVRYLEELGLDAHEMKREVMSDPDNGIFTNLWYSNFGLTKRPYIEINKWTTDADVTDSHRAIKAKLRAQDLRESENNSESSMEATTATGIKTRSKPSRDPLTALQAAILHDRSNETDEKDRRRKKWTYSKIAAHLNLASPRAAEDHVKVGRQMLKSKN